MEKIKQILRYRVHALTSFSLLVIITVVASFLINSTRNVDTALAHSNDTVCQYHTYYQDADHDGLGLAGTAVEICKNTAPGGYASNSNDINDNDADND